MRGSMNFKCGDCGVDLGDSATCAHVCQGKVTSDEIRLAFELGEARAQIAKLNRVVEAAREACAEDEEMQQLIVKAKAEGSTISYPPESKKVRALKDALAALDEGEGKEGGA